MTRQYHRAWQLRWFLFWMRKICPMKRPLRASRAMMKHTPDVLSFSLPVMRRQSMLIVVRYCEREGRRSSRVSTMQYEGAGWLLHSPPTSRRPFGIRRSSSR